MRLVPRTFDDLKRMTRTRAASHLLGLCNPITGERHVLPPLEGPNDLGRCDSYAIVTAADSDDLDGKQTAGRRFEFSQLLLITITTQMESDDDYAYLHSYSADTRSWSTPTMCLDGSQFSMVGERSAVVHQGAAHWLCIDRPSGPRGGDECLLYKLSADVGTAACTSSPPHASMAKIPIHGGGSRPLLFVSIDGKLSVACVYLLHVTVWTQQQAGGDKSGGGDTPATWLRTSVMRIPMAGPTPGPLCEPCGRCTWLDFNGGSMLVASGGVFVPDLDRKVVEKVMDGLLPQKFSSERNNPFVPERSCRGTTCVAYEMDLVEFFVRQLQLARWSMPQVGVYRSTE
jgi:hypothetical protein